MQRADRFEQLFKALKKHYKPVTPVSDRKVLDHLLYACCLQDASYEAADEALAKLQQAYFDSNEIRVTTIAELSESLTSLPHASAAANRIKKLLQAMFESRYSFDIDDLKKANLGKAVDEISGWQGVTKFMVSYVTQHAFGGHSIPVDESTLSVCHLLDLLTPAEVEKGSLPGIERAIAKNKGIEFATLLHQFAVDHAASHKHPLVVAVFKELGLTSKPKAPPPPPEPPKPAKVTPTNKKPEVKLPTKGAKSKPEVSSAQSSSTIPDTASPKTKKSESTSSKTVAAKPSKDDSKPKPVRPTKMAASPSSASKSVKSPVAPSKSTTSSSKSTPTSTDKNTKAKPAAKVNAKLPEKPAAKKPASKKAEAKKPLTKKGSTGSAAKSDTKRAASIAKPLPKKLPVKPVTKKRTKPR
jgi:endonuclease III